MQTGRAQILEVEWGQAQNNVFMAPSADQGRDAGRLGASMLLSTVPVLNQGEMAHFVIIFTLNSHITFSVTTSNIDYSEWNSVWLQAAIEAYIDGMDVNEGSDPTIERINPRTGQVQMHYITQARAMIVIDQARRGACFHYDADVKRTFWRQVGNMMVHVRRSTDGSNCGIDAISAWVKLLRSAVKPPAPVGLTDWLNESENFQVDSTKKLSPLELYGYSKRYGIGLTVVTEEKGALVPIFNSEEGATTGVCKLLLHNEHYEFIKDIKNQLWQCPACYKESPFECKKEWSMQETSLQFIKFLQGKAKHVCNAVCESCGAVIRNGHKCPAEIFAQELEAERQQAIRQRLKYNKECQNAIEREALEDTTFESGKEPDADEIYRLITEDERNVLIHGAGGCGKTWIAQELIARLRAKDWYICSTTGISSLNFECGMTLHALFGVGTLSDTASSIARRLFKAKPGSSKGDARDRILGMNGVIIDEVSMLSGLDLTKLDKVLRIVRKTEKVMGGIQTVFTGDFLQLPPVVSSECGGKHLGTVQDNGEASNKYAFCCKTWKELNLYPAILRTKRRFEDPIYAEMMDRLRISAPTADDIRNIFSRMVLNESVIPEEVPRIYSTRRQVDNINLCKVNALGGVTNTYPRSVTDSSHPRDSKAEKVVLKVGARVMCLFNHWKEKGIANGSMGKVLEFAEKKKEETIPMPVVEFDNGAVIKMEYIYNDEEKCFHFPLCLAYAITIHKMQGQSLDSCAMCLDNTVFEASQAYVALSRVRKLAGLYILSFDPSSIKCNPITSEYVYKLETYGVVEWRPVADDWVENSSAVGDIWVTRNSNFPCDDESENGQVFTKMTYTDRDFTNNTIYYDFETWDSGDVYRG